MTPGTHRRSILAAAGAIGVGMTGIASADHESEKDDCGWQPDKDGRTCSLKCHESPADFYEPKECHDPCKEPWYESSITFHNCGSCTRHIEVRVSGEVSPHQEPPSEMSNISNQSYHLEAGERKTFWFTGTIVGLHAEPGDINIAISLRAQHHAKGSQCQRGS